MSRYYRIVAALVLLLAGAGLFNLKHIVENKERQLKALQTQVLDDQRSIRVLKAEWAYLNRPENIQNLAVTYLGLMPTAPRNIYASLSELPWRVDGTKIASPLVDYIAPQPDMPIKERRTASLDAGELVLFEGTARQPVDAISLLLSNGRMEGGLP